VGKRSSRVVFGKFSADASGTTANTRRNRKRTGDEKTRIRANKLRCPHNDATVFQ
jgi:hypothetical protein